MCSFPGGCGYSDGVKPLLTLGIMSGTSLDGVDYALCETSERTLRLRALWQVPFPAALRRRLAAAAVGSASSWETAQLHHDLGRFYVQGARANPGRERARLIGLHGQTIFHQPDPRSPATLQIGEPAYLAEAFGIPVISNFRVADLAAGGQGAPLATAFHLRAFGLPGRHVRVNNLGGISNVTSIDWRRGNASPRVLAFDTGPANVLIDLGAAAATEGRSSFDRDGRGAARGRVCEPLLDEWLRHAYFRQAPPKSTGRELFGESFWQEAQAAARRRRMSSFDLLATVTEFTARSIALNYRLHLPAAPEVTILCGGGARNPVLRQALARALGGLGMETSVVASEDLGWPLSSVEPAAFAWLAWVRWQGRPGNLPETTGARRAVLCGQVSAPTAGDRDREDRGIRMWQTEKTSSKMRDPRDTLKTA